MAVSAFGAQKRKWYKVSPGVRWCRNLWGGSKVTVAEAVRWARSSTIWMLVGYAKRRSFRVVPINGSWVVCACDWGPGGGTIAAPLQQSVTQLGIAKQLLLSVGYEAVAAIVLTTCEPRKHPVLGCQRRSNPSSGKPSHPSHPFGASLVISGVGNVKENLRCRFGANAVSCLLILGRQVCRGLMGNLLFIIALESENKGVIPFFHQIVLQVRIIACGRISKLVPSEWVLRKSKSRSNEHLSFQFYCPFA